MTRMRSPGFYKWFPAGLSVALLVTLLAMPPLLGAPPSDAMPPPTVTVPPEPAPPAGAHVFCVFGSARPEGDRTRLQLTSHLAAAMADERPEVVLGTGDYIDGAATAAGQQALWDDFWAALKPLQKRGTVPLAAAVGAADVRGGMGEIFVSVMGKRYYSFEVGAAHFIILDTEQPGQEGRITGEQWNWLWADLQAAQNASHLFVALSRPLFPVGALRGEALDRYPRYRDRLHQLFVQMKISAVFAGGERLYNHEKRDGVNYFITGGGGAPLDTSEGRDSFPHYLKVTFTAADYAVTVQRL